MDLAFLLEVCKDHSIGPLKLLAGDMEAIPHSEESDTEDIPEFKWGESRGDGGTDNEVLFYKSFTYDGVEYSLYDCVCLFGQDVPEEPHIGKLVKIWELQDHRKFIKVVWFFRRSEIVNFLGDEAPLKNEIFLASGNGIGLYNDNLLEALVGKCSVVCTSKDSRNPQPSEAEVRMADYVFYRTFDVQKRAISDRFEDKIAGTEVRHFFNAERHTIISDPKLGVNWHDNLRTESSSKLDLPEAVATTAKNAKPGVQTNTAVKGAESKRSIASALDESRISDEGKQKSVQDLLHLKASDSKLSKGMLLIGESARPSKKLESNVSPTLTKEESLTNILPNLRVGLEETAENPPGSSYKAKSEARKDLVGQNRSKWFKQLPWEDAMHRSNEQGTLVLLRNLDPCYTSAEVEDIVLHAFKESCTAKMIQRNTFSSPYCGEAYVIFKTKEAAEMAIAKLDSGCLMQPNGRPIVGCKQAPTELGRPSSFCGHLSINKIKSRLQRPEKRDAVSTAHFSQANTIEYDMALEWCLLQERSKEWWKVLHERHEKDCSCISSKSSYYMSMMTIPAYLQGSTRRRIGR
ncbi:hypothetical protein NE237_025728 [Protea cynaroides]|uniref:BAH domain-containing protein n=1 Tax=Protea cynaroides TaxID=273540 RepID=A0A9Q0H6S6_9MAGN|nr:hypothetical protein NE237_025728 [Protea cynaroides]